MKRDTRKTWPVLVTGFTRGLYHELHRLTGPIWDEWCLLHDYLYRPIALHVDNRHGALTSKFSAMMPWLEGGHPVLWADADALPVLKSPDPGKGTTPERSIAAVVIPKGRPRTGHVLTGLLYARPDAVPVLRRAVELQRSPRYAFVCQRALAAALQGLKEIVTPEAPPTRSTPIVHLDKAWFRSPQSRIPPAGHAYLWHATVGRLHRIPTIKQWIAQGRHVHPPGEQLPLAWRKVEPPTKT